MNELDSLLKHYKELQNKGLNIDATRGKPCKEQLDLSLPMFNVLNENTNFVSNGVDVRNYGALDGIKEAKQLFADLLEVDADNVIVGGNASLNLMYDLVSKSVNFGVLGNKPWKKPKKIKWICLIPGYDRHFAICEHFGFKLISVPLNNDGPDIDKIKKIIKDKNVKGMWCVPKFSNPSGITYSNKVVKELANLKPAAKDFRIYWDNAYCVHDFDVDKPVKLLNIFKEAKKCDNEDMIYEFASTSKISFAGAGISCITASKNNIEDIKKNIFYETIGYDKVNQLRHALFFKNRNGIRDHMRMHAKILEPKFKKICSVFSKELKGYANWSVPKGGYFISLSVKGVANEVIKRCGECGVKLTPAGSSHPYHKDPNNEYIRIAPSCLKMEEIAQFCDVLVTSIKIEKLINK